MPILPPFTLMDLLKKEKPMESIATKALNEVQSPINFLRAQIHLIPVVGSSTIMAIGYDEPTLFVRFNGGVIYAYTPVKEQLWKDFREATSKGQFLDLNIKKNLDIKAERIK